VAGRPVQPRLSGLHEAVTHPEPHALTRGVRVRPIKEVIVDVGDYRFDIKLKRNFKGQKRWVVYFIGPNNEKVFWTEPYNTAEAAIDAINLIRNKAGQARLNWK
jgi:uncharacterized protein YegP (UPF0339 family)